MSGRLMRLLADIGNLGGFRDTIDADARDRTGFLRKTLWTRGTLRSGLGVLPHCRLLFWPADTRSGAAAHFWAPFIVMQAIALLLASSPCLRMHSKPRKSLSPSKNEATSTGLSDTPTAESPLPSIEVEPSPWTYSRHQY
jgi:hypothetical protein